MPLVLQVVLRPNREHPLEHLGWNIAVIAPGIKFDCWPLGNLFGCLIRICSGCRAELKAP